MRISPALRNSNAGAADSLRLDVYHEQHKNLGNIHHRIALRLVYRYIGPLFYTGYLGGFSRVFYSSPCALDTKAAEAEKEIRRRLHCPDPDCGNGKHFTSIHLAAHSQSDDYFYAVVHRIQPAVYACGG